MRLVVVPVIRDGSGRILLCKMAPDRGVFPGQWGLPGGGVEPGEGIEDALRREVREELGVGLTELRPLFFKDGTHDKLFPDGTRRNIYMAAIRAFVAAYDAGDLEGVLSYYDDDLVKVRQGAEPESKSETAARLSEVFRRCRTRVEVETLEIDVAGELAFTRGAFRVTVLPREGGPAQHIARRYLEVWRKREGRWLVSRTMDNDGPT